MPTGPKITPEVTNRIVSLFLAMRNEEPKTNASMVAERFWQEEKARDRNAHPNWPSKTAVRKILAKVRKREQELGPDRDDRPWSLAALSFCDIPPESVPSVVKVWGRSHFVTRKPFTVREAQWVGRLHHVFQDEKMLAAAARMMVGQERLMSLLDSYPATDDAALPIRVPDFVALAEVTDDPHLKIVALSTSIEAWHATMVSLFDETEAETYRKLLDLRIRELQREIEQEEKEANKQT